VVVLDEALLRSQAQLVLPLRAKGLAEEAALIAMHGGLERDEARKTGVKGLHRGKRVTLAYIRRAMEASVSASVGEADHRGSAWTVGPAEPRMTRDVVDVWRADLTIRDAEPVELLSTDERERAAGIVDEYRRVLWQRSRGLLRALLGRYLEMAPAEIELSLGTYGKPHLVHSANAPLELAFNLSHSGRVALYAFAEHAVGVDVQLARPAGAMHAGATHTRDYVALARRALGRDAAEHLQQIPRQRREEEFLRMWTRHEAVLKCSGVGIASAKSASAGQSFDDVLPWLAQLDVGSSAAAAVACAIKPRKLRLWNCT